MVMLGQTKCEEVTKLLACFTGGFLEIKCRGRVSKRIVEFFHISLLTSSYSDILLHKHLLTCTSPVGIQQNPSVSLLCILCLSKVHVIFLDLLLCSFLLKVKTC